jgi:hypothetical protein
MNQATNQANELQLAFENYLRVRHKFLKGEATAEEDYAAQLEYCTKLVSVIAGEPHWYMDRNRPKAAE